MAVLDSLLENLKEYTQKLDEVAGGGYDLENWLVLYATIHLLQVHAQAFIDIVQTLLSNMGQNVDGYKESVRKLRELGLIDDEEMRFALALVGFRNIVVHEYARVNVNVVKRVLANREYRKALEIAVKLREKAGYAWDC